MKNLREKRAELNVERLERHLDMIEAALRVGASRVRDVQTERRRVARDLVIAREKLEVMGLALGPNWVPPIRSSSSTRRRYVTRSS